MTLLDGLFQGIMLVLAILYFCGIIAFIIACIKKIWDIVKK